jgi:hypothetical protein
MPSKYNRWSIPKAGLTLSLEGKPRSSLWEGEKVAEGCGEPFFHSRYPDDREACKVRDARAAMSYYGLTAEWDAMWLHYFGHTAPPLVGIVSQCEYFPYRDLPKTKAIAEGRINYLLDDVSRFLRTYHIPSGW